MSTLNYASNAYRSNAVQTSGGKLVVMLYDGWLTALEVSKDAILKEDLGLAHEHLVRAQNIVGELINTLDMQYDISQQLRQLYEFFSRQLVEANVYKDISKIDAQYPLVKGLRDTWEQAMKQVASP